MHYIVDIYDIIIYKWFTIFKWLKLCFFFKYTFDSNQNIYFS